MLMSPKISIARNVRRDRTEGEELAAPFDVVED
jgi:hypothetical protein